MLAAHDQENRVFGQQAGAAAKQQLQPKTPGARYPKTPLKVPLNDENANYGLGKSVLGAKLGGGNENVMTIGKGGNAGATGKANWVTPLEPRTNRAPLGNKTTNAKARTTQTLAVKDIVQEIEKSQLKPNTVQRPKPRSPKAEPFKLDVLNDQTDPLGGEEEEIEYCPPRPTDLPYESDIIPEGALTTESLKPENMFKGYHDYYHRAVDECGMTRLEREMEKRKENAFRKAEKQIQKDLDEFEWDLGLDDDGPRGPGKKKLAVFATSDKPPSVVGRKTSRVVPKQAPPTIAARKAASVLAIAPKAPVNPQQKLVKPMTRHARSASSFLPGRRPAAQKVPASKDPLSAENTAAMATSRSTLGYTKGRTASSALHGRTSSENASRRTLTRSVSTASSGSDTTITPARFAAKSKNSDSSDLRRPEFLSIFDINEDDDGHLGVSADLINDDLDDDFEFKVNF
ncbi:hypothetical protein NKR23_g6973 [Pleurostoma richardsiae]|uniref:Uncharacterized protein n=1 Tax=Pleurostoma richardsiae TaxID=41990 RepID=A0AA38VRI9_9PEZI|nr:hypothetical protein NKR23_g6973 [Pleurostoma richardsiae]